MTPFDAALSSARDATAASSAALALSPASTASRKRRTWVLSADLVALLRWCDFSFVLIRLSWDLMLATCSFPRAYGWVRPGPGHSGLRYQREPDRPNPRARRRRARGGPPVRRQATSTSSATWEPMSGLSVKNPS